MRRRRGEERGEDRRGQERTGERAMSKKGTAERRLKSEVVVRKELFWLLGGFGFGLGLGMCMTVFPEGGNNKHCGEWGSN